MDSSSRKMVHVPRVATKLLKKLFRTQPLRNSSARKTLNQDLSSPGVPRKMRKN
jgi:hypothetical protein